MSNIKDIIVKAAGGIGIIAISACNTAGTEPSIQSATTPAGGKLATNFDDPVIRGPAPSVIRVGGGCIFQKRADEYVATCCPSNEKRIIEEAKKRFTEITGTESGKFRISDDCNDNDRSSDAPERDAPSAPAPDKPERDSPATGGCAGCGDNPSTPGGDSGGPPGSGFNDASYSLPKDVIVAGGKYFTTAPETDPETAPKPMRLG